MIIEVLCEQEIRDHAPEHLLDLVPQHLRHLRIHEDGALLVVYRPDAFAGQLDDAPVHRLALARQFLGHHAIGHVTRVVDDEVGALEVVARRVKEPALSAASRTPDAEVVGLVLDEAVPHTRPGRLIDPAIQLPDPGAHEMVPFGFERLAGEIVHIHDGAVGGDRHDRHRGVVDGEERKASRFRRAPLSAAQLGALDGASHGRRQPDKVVLEDVVHGAGGDGRHCRLLGDGAGDRDGRRVRGEFGEQVERLGLAKARQVEVDEGDLPLLGGQRLAQRLGAFHTLPLWCDVCVAKACEHQFDIVCAVFDEQDAQVHEASPRRWTGSLVRTYPCGVTSSLGRRGGRGVSRPETPAPSPSSH